MIVKMRKNISKKGLTLVELLIAVAMLAIIATVTLSVFNTILSTWSGLEARAGLGITFDSRMELMVRDLRDARAIGLINDDELRFTTEERGIDKHYIYYFYNKEDAYPPAFTESSYELRKAVLTPDINGKLIDAGNVKLGNLLPPETSDMSFDAGGMITLDLSVSTEEETLRLRTEVKPRNL